MSSTNAIWSAAKTERFSIFSETLTNMGEISAVATEAQRYIIEK
jgi:hypothetical protein